MSITVKSTPADYGSYMSGHNDLFFVIDSTNKAADNYKYVFDIYIDSVLVSRVKVFPDPAFGYGVFNAGPVVRNYLHANYFGGQGAFLTDFTDDGFRKTFQVKYGEEFGAPVVLTSNIVVGDPVNAFNYYNQLLPINTPSKLGTFTNKFLSSFSGSYEVSPYDNFFIYYWNTGLTVDVTITYYNASGTVLGTNTDGSSAALIQFNAGPLGINQTFSNAITSDVHHYTVTVATGGLPPQTLTFYLDEWPKYVPQTLVFLNELGGYETAYFRMKNRRKTGAERKTYGQNNYQLNGSGGRITYNQMGNVLRGESKTYSVKQSNKFTMCTDFLSDAEFEHLSNLFQSSQVYMEFKRVVKHGSGSNLGEIISEGGVVIITEADEDIITQSGTTDPIYYTLAGVSYMPVKITSDNYEFKTRAADHLNPLELEVEILQTYNSQYQ